MGFFRIDLGPPYGGVFATQVRRDLLPTASAAALAAFDLEGNATPLCAELPALQLAAAHLYHVEPAGRA